MGYLCPSLHFQDSPCVCVVMSDSLWPHGLQPARLLRPWDSPGKNSRVGCHFLLQWIFPTQGLSPDLLHCRKILYCLSHQGSPTFNICVFKAEVSLVCRTWLGLVFLFVFFSVSSSMCLICCPANKKWNQATVHYAAVGFEIENTFHKYPTLIKV